MAKTTVPQNSVLYADEKNIIHKTTNCSLKFALVRPVFAGHLPKNSKECNHCFPGGIASPHSAHEIARRLFSGR
jgi:hypothetical protein